MSKEELLKELENVNHSIENFDPSDYYSKNDYQDELDQNGIVEICGMEYGQGAALRAIDPIAFNCAYADFCSELEAENFEEYKDLLQEKEDIENELEALEEETK